jgi:hypothetical protein
MKHTTGTANGTLHTATLASALPLRGREGGVCLFSADLSWAREQAPASSRTLLARTQFTRIALFALLALAVVGVVVMNGPADAGPNRSLSKALPDPVSEAEVEAVVVDTGHPVARLKAPAERTAAR